MVTREVKVEQVVSVTVDETKFTDAFMAEFRGSMYPFDTLNDHLEHLAQMYARGLCDEFTTFIEGYGPPKEMGIEAAVTHQVEEVMDAR